MIKYRLNCAQGHDFEAWFRTSDKGQTVSALAQPDHRGVVEPHRPRDERGEVLAMGGVFQPDPPLGTAHRNQRCKYSC